MSSTHLFIWKEKRSNGHHFSQSGWWTSNKKHNKLIILCLWFVVCRQRYNKYQVRMAFPFPLNVRTHFNYSVQIVDDSIFILHFPLTTVSFINRIETRTISSWKALEFAIAFILHRINHSINLYLINEYLVFSILKSCNIGNSIVMNHEPGVIGANEFILCDKNCI